MTDQNPGEPATQASGLAADDHLAWDRPSVDRRPCQGYGLRCDRDRKCEQIQAAMCPKFVDGGFPDLDLVPKAGADPTEESDSRDFPGAPADERCGEHACARAGTDDECTACPWSPKPIRPSPCDDCDPVDLAQCDNCEHQQRDEATASAAPVAETSATGTENVTVVYPMEACDRDEPCSCSGTDTGCADCRFVAEPAVGADTSDLVSPGFLTGRLFGRDDGVVVRLLGHEVPCEAEILRAADGRIEPVMFQPGRAAGQLYRLQVTSLDGWAPCADPRPFTTNNLSARAAHDAVDPFVGAVFVDHHPKTYVARPCRIVEVGAMPGVKSGPLASDEMLVEFHAGKKLVAEVQKVKPIRPVPPEAFVPDAVLKRNDWANSLRFSAAHRFRALARAAKRDQTPEAWAQAALEHDACRAVGDAWARGAIPPGLECLKMKSRVLDALTGGGNMAADVRGMVAAWQAAHPNESAVAAMRARGAA